MKARNYYIFMEEVEGLDEGWYCGVGARCNSVFYRCSNKQDANAFDDVTSLLLVVQFRKLGYPCKVMPKLSAKRQLEILVLEYSEEEEE